MLRFPRAAWVVLSALGLSAQTPLAPPTVSPHVSAIRHDPPRIVRPPLTFEANRGQMHDDVRFVGRGDGLDVLLTDRDAVFLVQQRPTGPPRTAWRQPPAGRDLDRPWPEARSSRVVRLAWQGGARSTPIGEAPRPARTHYARSGAGAAIEAPHVGRVRYSNVYPGVDVAFYGHGAAVEYDVLVAPHSDVSPIAATFDGADRLEVDSEGRLHITAGDEELIQQPPVAWQDTPAGRQTVEVAYHLDGAAVRFHIGRYNPALPLTIDPVVVPGSYLGGKGDDYLYAMAVDLDGAIYVSGATTSVDLPVNGAQVFAPGALDAFVTKLSPDAAVIEYSTYLGGTGDDAAYGIAVEANGRAWVTGATASSDFPTVSPLQGDQPFDDAFVARLSPDGSALEVATLLGGSQRDYGFAIALHADGTVTLVGATRSTDFPMLGAAQPSHAGSTDGFVTRLTVDGAAIAWSSFLGGVDVDVPVMVAAGADGRAYVTGYTTSADFPVLGPWRAYAGDLDGFAAAYDDSGALAYSTLVGGAGFDFAAGIVVNAQGEAYIAGYTDSTDFPTAGGGDTFKGAVDGFLVKLAADGASAVYASAIGSSGGEVVYGLALEPGVGPILVGVTDSPTLPVLAALQPEFAGGSNDAFVMRLNDEGVVQRGSTYFGGAGWETGIAAVMAPNGSLVIGGYGWSNDVPIEGGAIAEAPGGADSWVAVIALPPLVEPTPGDFTGDGAADLMTVASSTLTWRAASLTDLTFGDVGDVPAPADYDGDGRTDYAIFRPGSAQWQVQAGALTTLGARGDVPVPADYDGDGAAERAVFRPATGTWIVDGASPVVHGVVGDLPVPADYDGDGDADRAVFRPATGTWHVHGQDGVSWGQVGDIPVPADFTGDGIAEIAVFRPSTATWYVRGVTTFVLGGVGDLPLAQDLDGDGQADAVVFRPSTGGFTSWNLATSVTAHHAGGGPGEYPAMLPPWLRRGVTFDVDGDRRADAGVVRPGTGVWYLHRSSGAAATSLQWGAGTDRAVPGDYDGDHRLDVAVFRPASGVWYVRYSASGFTTGLTLSWGGPDDVPVPADYDGDGRTDVAVFRPSTGTWYWRTSSSEWSQWRSRAWGTVGDVPVPADYDGDGRADLAVVRNGTWYLTSSGQGYASLAIVTWGASTDRWAPYDADGDGRADLGVFRPATGVWYVRLSSTAYATAQTVAYGQSGDVPVPADFNGDGRGDVAVFRPASGFWYRQGSATLAWGTSGDVPLPRR